MNQKIFGEIRSIFKGKDITEILNYIFYGIYINTIGAFQNN